MERIQQRKDRENSAPVLPSAYICRICEKDCHSRIGQHGYSSGWWDSACCNRAAQFWSDTNITFILRLTSHPVRKWSRGSNATLIVRPYCGIYMRKYVHPCYDPEQTPRFLMLRTIFFRSYYVIFVLLQIQQVCGTVNKSNGLFQSVLL